MTDRVNALLVVLERDLREDDVQPLVEAIKQMRHVQSVKPNVANFESAIAQGRATIAVVTKVQGALGELMGEL